MHLNKSTFPPLLGGALLPHAPQFFTRPDTEDAANIARVEKVAATIGEQLSALKPDVWITISNDHAQQFFLDCAPPFALHVGGEARGHFAGKDFRYAIASEVSFALIRELYAPVLAILPIGAFRFQEGEMRTGSHIGPGEAIKGDDAQGVARADVGQGGFQAAAKHAAAGSVVTVDSRAAGSPPCAACCPRPW